VKSAPATPWTFTVLYLVDGQGTNFITQGFVSANRPPGSSSIGGTAITAVGRAWLLGSLILQLSARHLSLITWERRTSFTVSPTTVRI
jgi:hypothetical protein